MKAEAEAGNENEMKGIRTQRKTGFEMYTFGPVIDIVANNISNIHNSYIVLTALISG